MDKQKILYYAQLTSAVLSVVVSSYAIYNIIKNGYNNNPNFFRSRTAKRIFVALVFLIILSTLTYLRINKWAKKNEMEMEGF